MDPQHAASDRPAAHLVLADGTVFSGVAIGARRTTVGEVVFTTGMTGYQEVLTDPSYRGQIVTMTAPHIGNTGTNTEDPESFDGRPQVAGFAFRDPSPVVSNWRSELPLSQYLEQHGIVAIAGVDTRRLTRYLRDRGSQNACIGTGDPSALVERARAVPSMEGLDLVRQVTPTKPEAFSEGYRDWDPFSTAGNGTRTSLPPPKPGGYHVVAMDFGAKRSIMRLLVQSGCRVTRVPATMSAQEIETLLR